MVKLFVRRVSGFICSGALAASGLLCAQGAPAKPTPPANPAPALLPEEFAGWIQSAAPQIATDAVQADAANAAALKEYGFNRGETASYKRGDETLQMHALSFGDTSGAYGAYSYYRQSGWPKEEIGSGAASDHNRVIFWLGTTVVDANFSRMGPMSGAELREVASHLPLAEGNKAVTPPVLSYLPKASLDGQTSHYALGPAGYAGSGGVLPPALIGFDEGAETVTANYSLRSGPATLTVIDYPTPQMAVAAESKVRSYVKAGNQAQNPWPQPLADSDQASLEVRRSGPLVALVSGDAIPDESHKLIELVHYDADLISIPQPSESEVAKTSKLLLGIATIVLIGSVTAILLGVFFGGGRALFRVARGKAISSVYDEEFISLDLAGEWVKSPPATEGPNPKG
jgi:hypothetical protein